MIHNETIETINGYNKTHWDFTGYFYGYPLDWYRAKKKTQWTPELNRAYSMASMAVSRGAVLPRGVTLLEAAEYTVPFLKERDRLTEETGEQHNISHIIPCQVGGAHAPDNMRVLPASETPRGKLGPAAKVAFELSDPTKDFYVLTDLLEKVGCPSNNSARLFDTDIVQRAMRDYGWALGRKKDFGLKGKGFVLYR